MTNLLTLLQTSLDSLSPLLMFLERSRSKKDLSGQVVGTFKHDATSQEDDKNKICHDWVGITNQNKVYY